MSPSLFPLPWRGRVDRLSAALLLIAVTAALAIARLPLLTAAVACVAVVVVLLTLIEPLFGLGLALVLGPFGALENVILGNALLDSGQLLLLLTVAAWVAGNLARRRFFIPVLPLNLPLALLLLALAVSLLDAESLALGLRELLKWLEIGLIMLLVANLALEREATGEVLRRLLFAVLLAGLVQAVVGIWQFGLRGDGPEHFLVLGRFYRAYGTFEQPNPYAGYLNLSALLALGLVWGLLAALAGGRLRPDGRDRAGQWLRPWFSWLAFTAIVAGLAGLGVFFSWSRGAWLGYLAGLAVLILFASRRLWVGLGLLLVAGGLAGGLLAAGLAAGLAPAEAAAGRLSGFVDDFRFGDVRGVDITDENYAVLERLAHWQAALDMARDDVWTGVGAGNYEVAYARYALINWPDALGHAHNYYLNMLAETGVLGLAAYLFFWGAVFWLTFRAIRLLAWPERGLAVGLAAAWAALTVHHLVDKLYVNNVYIHVGALLGLLQLGIVSARAARAPLPRRDEE